MTESSTDAELGNLVMKHLKNNEIYELLVVTARMCFDGEGMKYVVRCKGIVGMTGVVVADGVLSGRLGFLDRVNRLECARF